MIFDFTGLLKEILNMNESDEINIKVGGHRFIIKRKETCNCHEIGKNGLACDDTLYSCPKCEEKVE